MFCGHCIIRPNISAVTVVSDVPFQSKKSQELKVQKAATVSEPVDELAALRAAALKSKVYIHIYIYTHLRLLGHMLKIRCFESS